MADVDANSLNVVTWQAFGPEGVPCVAWGMGASVARDTVAPTISNRIPATALTRWQTLSFDVRDAGPGLGMFAIGIRFWARNETQVAYINGAFLAPYATHGTLATLGDGYRVTLRPDAGWLEPFDLLVWAIDADGNVMP